MTDGRLEAAIVRIADPMREGLGAGLGRRAGVSSCERLAPLHAECAKAGSREDGVRFSNLSTRRRPIRHDA